MSLRRRPRDSIIAVFRRLFPGHRLRMNWLLVLLLWPVVAFTVAPVIGRALALDGRHPSTRGAVPTRRSPLVLR